MSKYGSIRETFIGAPLIQLATLSVKATPPADLNLLFADFTPNIDLYSGRTTLGLKRGNFRLNDVPRIVGVGLWCNIADGLVQIDNPDTEDKGLVFSIVGRSFNSGGVLQQPDIFVGYTQPKVSEFNNIVEVDYLLNQTTLNYSLTGQPADSGSGYYRLTVNMQAVTADFATISIDPAYATKPFYIRPMVVVEHTYPLLVAGF